MTQSSDNLFVPAGQVPTLTFTKLNVGRLGATFDERGGWLSALSAQVDMLERHVVRIEALLAKSGIDLDTADLSAPDG